MAAKRRYEVGLQKLEYTEQQVVIMQNELTELQPKLIRCGHNDGKVGQSLQKEVVVIMQNELTEVQPKLMRRVRMGIMQGDP